MKNKIYLTGLLTLSVIVAVAITSKIEVHSKVNKLLENDTIVKKVDSFAVGELIQVFKKLNKARSINARFNLDLIDLNSNSIVETFDGVYLKSENNIYIKTFLSENLIADNYIVAIDHADKIMFVEKPEIDKSGELSASVGLFDLDSLVNLSDSMVIYQKINDRESKLIVQLGYSSYESMEVIYNFDKKEIVKLVLYPFSEFFNQVEEGEIGYDGHFMNNEDEAKYKIVINYSKLALNEDVKSELLKSSHYFTSNGKTLRTTSKFNDYEIDFE